MTVAGAPESTPGAPDATPDDTEVRAGAPAVEKPRPTSRGIRRVLALAVLAMGAFAAAIVVLSDDARLGCVVDAQRDASYEARLLGQAEIEKTAYDIAVTRNGEPIKGAKVCASIAMMGMEAMGVSDTADEGEPGIYKVDIVLEMSGGWRGNILITETGKPPVSVPLRFDVS